MKNGRPAPSKRSAAPRKPTARPSQQGVRITHAGRVVYESAGLTKQDVVDYYRAVADRILPEIARRPISLVRCPDGAERACFFQKHHADRLGRHVKGVTLREKSGTRARYIHIESADGLIELVQMNTIELHVWGATIDAPDRPDRLVFDLDPAPGIAWKAVIDAAHAVGAHLHDAGLESFVRLTGGKGVHVVAPIDRGPNWDEAKAFCENVARELAAKSPETFIATASKSRRTNRIFIDWLRNARGATSVASWSLRARPGAPVAMPLRWEEFDRTAGASIYGLVAAKRRASALRKDPWAGFDTLRQSLPSADA